MKLERTSWKVEKSVSQVSLCYLVESDWDDFGFQTMFEAVLFDERGIRYDLGYLRILRKGMGSGRVAAPQVSTGLGDRYCSLGSSLEYYRRLSECPEPTRSEYLRAIRDVVFDGAILMDFEDQPGFQKSLLRDVSRRDVSASFPRALQGDAELTPYRFSYSFINDDETSGELAFSVEPQSRPPSNIHVLIGRNGVGKTRLLAGIADALTDNRAASIGLSGRLTFDDDVASTAPSEFLNLVVVSYSVFDKFDPINTGSERTETSIPQYYIGLKSSVEDAFQADAASIRVKSRDEVLAEFRSSIGNVVGDPNKRVRLARALGSLRSDPMINDLRISDLLNGDDDAVQTLPEVFERLSSGHKVVILTLVRLVELVSDRSLVLIDEPETHLHPPLLASFARALSELLQSRNGVAIVATHSPVMLQEVPSNCVQVIQRTGGATSISRPDTETFGENVGTLTRRVFELEAENSGFYRMLVDSARERTFEEVLQLFDDRVGGEGRAIVRANALRASSEEPPSSN